MKKLSKFFRPLALAVFGAALVSCANEPVREDIGGWNSSYVGSRDGAGQRSGFGTLTFRNGTVHTGMWENNLQHGIGSRTDPDGNVTFAGEFIGGAPMYTYEELGYETAAALFEQADFLRAETAKRERLASLERRQTQAALLEQARRQRLRTQQENERAITEELSGDFDTKILNVQKFLGRILSLVNQRNGRAIEWLKKAAEQGNPEAQYHLGYNLVRGQGIAQDEEQAEYWLTSSAVAGNANSRKELQRSLGWTINQVNIRTVMKPRCTSFGFEEGTDGHATCVMELQVAEEALAQARELAEEARELAEETQNEINQRFNEIEDARERAAAIGAAQQQAARRYEAEQRRVAEEQSRQRALGRALMSIGAGISSGRGIGPGSSSNSGGMYQTCNYNVLGEIVPYPISSARICPMSMDFGGVAGTLQ